MFQSKFDKYLKNCKCSAKTISAMTGISESTVSRYRSGKTVPSIDSGNIEKIAEALSKLYGGETDKDDIYEDLFVAAYEDLEMVDYDVYSRKLSLLIREIGINMSNLAEHIHISVSHLSKICSAQVKPRSPVYIAEGVSQFVVDYYSDIEHQNVVKKLIWGEAVKLGAFTSRDSYYRHIRKWLLNGENEKSILVENLLYRFGEFDKDRYLSYSRNLKLAANAIEAHHNDSHLFTGLDGLEDAVFSWMNDACNSKVNDEIFMFDEIFLQIARRDYKYGFMWIAAMEKLIRSGKKIIHVHNLENNLNLMTREMLLVLPLTMSSRVYHYFINESKENLYRNMLFVSSESALIGNAVGNDPSNGYYMQITDSSDIEVARLRARRIIKLATQSCVLFDNPEDFQVDFSKMINGLSKEDTVYVYLSVPALSTMDESRLRRILEKNDVSQSGIDDVIRLYHKEKDAVEELAKNHKMNISVDYVSPDRWIRNPQYLAINIENPSLRIPYDYEDYEQHMEETKALSAKYSNIEMKIENMNFFRNMTVIFVPDKYAAALTMDTKLTNASTVKKPIVDSIQDLMYIITPSNADAVQADEGRKDLLQYYKGMVN